MAHSKETIALALSYLESGIPPSEVAAELKVSRATLWSWAKKAKEENKDDKTTLENLKKQLATLSKRKPTDATARKIAMVSKAIGTAERSAAKKEKIKEAPPKPLISVVAAGSLRERAINESSLFGYQKEFMEDLAQFRIVLKARQIGFSYVAALDALCGATEGRNQLFLSASEEQALILMRYVDFWAQKHGVEFVKNSEKEKTLPNGVVIKALAHNWRTAQGFTGDIWMDEFAWYANPKKIWHAFVPSIGAIKGRFTIMSTPFEEAGLFHELNFDEAKYFMFSRHRIDIYRAIKDGLEFDLEVMRALFDADTWASAYECQFIDDESAMFPISLIKSCVNPNLMYYTPDSRAILNAGYDVGRVKDLSTNGVLEMVDGGKYKLAAMDVLRKASFDEQEMHIKTFMNTYQNASLKIDKTGIGLNLAERMETQFKSRVTGVHFTAMLKEGITKNLKKMFEDKLIEIPNDPMLISDIHAIKRRAGQKGFLYDADRNAYGHADRYWALALAASYVQLISKKRSGRGYVVGG